MRAQIPAFTLQFICIFHIQYVGKQDRIRSSATEMARFNISSSKDVYLPHILSTYLLAFVQ